ncbi:MAG: hypothetical protein AB1816_20580, partial [Bacillota bacterium]
RPDRRLQTSPDRSRAYQARGEAAQHTGALTECERRLVNLALVAGVQTGGRVHRQVRKALAADLRSEAQLPASEQRLADPLGDETPARGGNGA